MTGGAAINAMLSGAEFIYVYVGMPVPTYAFSLYVRPEIKDVTDLRGKTLGVITKGAFSDHASIALLRQYKMTQHDLKVLYFSRQEDARTASGTCSSCGTLRTHHPDGTPTRVQRAGEHRLPQAPLSIHGSRR